MPTTERQEESSLPPAGLADLDPSLGEQTKGQAKSGLKDNNTIQKVSMRHSTNGLFPSTVQNRHCSKGALFYTAHSFSICPRSVHETPIYNVSSLRDLPEHTSSAFSKRDTSRTWLPVPTSIFNKMPAAGRTLL